MAVILLTLALAFAFAGGFVSGFASHDRLTAFLRGIDG